MSNYIRRFEDASLAVGSTTPYLYNYRYDQLNRLTGQDAYTGLNSSSNTWTLTATDYLKERVSYDPNGNIVRYLRNSPFGSNVAMDSLTYTYYPGSNKLKHIRDVVPSTNWAPKYNMADDLNGQTDASNYFYDAIGNLTYDETERVHVMKWSVYGKLKEQTRTTGWGPRAQTQRYTYDAQGNRIGTRIMHDGKAIYTWYVRDAQGNILSVYSTTGTQSNIADMTLAQTERHIYGSNRLGVVTSTGVDIDRANAGPALLGTPERTVFGRGIRQYELSNHLGNVLSTISDKKIGVPYVSNSSLIEYYKPDIITASEYYPFGMISRTHTRSSFAVHKFGFNGKENDNLLKGIGGQQDYGMRVYDPRLARFLSLDPISSDFPFYTPYQFAGNKPIWAIDLDGMEEWMQTQANLQKQRAVLQMKSLTTPRAPATVSAYNPGDKTFAQRWRDSKNFFAKLLYSPANGLYTLPQQLTADIRKADYITNIGGNSYPARGIFGEKQRVENFNNGATLFVPGTGEGQALKTFAFADDLFNWVLNLGMMF